MKKPEYVASVVSLYRKYLDKYLENGSENYKVEEKDIIEAVLLTDFTIGTMAAR